MSSVRPSSSSSISHSRHASCTSAAHAARGSPAAATISTTFWSASTSKTPSEHSTTCSAAALSASELNSGSAHTPSGLATRSPMERVKVQPGTSSSRLKTRSFYSHLLLTPSVHSTFYSHLKTRSFSPSSAASAESFA